MYLLTAAGWLSLALGAIGLFLPVLPTTPFVLLAAGCFAKSSPRLHLWLKQSSLFGNILTNWEQHRCIPARSKKLAISMIVLFGGTSVIFAVPSGIGQLGAGLLVLIGLVVVLRLKTC